LVIGEICLSVCRVMMVTDSSKVSQDVQKM